MPKPISPRPEVRVAVVQANPRIADKAVNLARVLKAVEVAAKQGAKLVAFTEAELTGYCYDSLAEALPQAEEVPGPATEAITNLAKQYDVYIVCGLLEVFREKLYNTTVLIGPEGLLGTYRKTHHIFLGVDRFTAKGDLPYTVFATPIGKIGLIICYDLLFPEASRALALQGADIIVDATNLPVGSEAFLDTLLPARAMENRVFILASSRVGTERGTRFLGASSIVDPYGRFLVRSGSQEESIVYADLNLTKARKKQTIIKQGEYEFDLFKDRRPELYGQLTKTDIGQWK